MGPSLFRTQPELTEHPHRLFEQFESAVDDEIDELGIGPASGLRRDGKKERSENERWKDGLDLGHVGSPL